MEKWHPVEDRGTRCQNSTLSKVFEEVGTLSVAICCDFHSANPF